MGTLEANNRKDDYPRLRAEMVKYDLRRRDISDPRVLEAFGKVPREIFVPERLRKDAYEDHPVVIGHGQTISQPYMVALMTQELRLQGHERVLEIGTGSGYQTAILAELCREVLTVERIPELAENSRNLLSAAGYANIKFRVGDGTLGWPEEAPFDRILVTAAAKEAPESLKQQLAPLGQLIIPVGSSHHQWLNTITRREDGGFDTREGCACIFVKLIGKEGWEE